MNCNKAQKDCPTGKKRAFQKRSELLVMCNTIKEGHELTVGSKLTDINWHIYTT